MQKLNSEFVSELLLLAKNFCPEGTLPDALVDQWLISYAYKKEFYASSKVKILINNVFKKFEYADEVILKKILISDMVIPSPSSPNFTFIDLFAGIGGMRLGFQAAGGLCVFSSEFEKNAQETYKVNHSEMPFGDITKIPVDDIPSHDILIAGFPCQPFSHAGLKLGIDDTRGTLFHNIAEILKVKKPKFALLENVRGLISHDKGYTLQVILKTLTKIGYSCNISKDIIESGLPSQIQVEAKKMVLRAIDFGVPQNRQRIYIVLWLDNLIDKFDYPTMTSFITKVGDILEKNPDIKYTISDRLWEGHQRRKISNAQNGKGFGYSLVNENSPYTATISARYYKDGSEVLIEQPGKNPRKITPREAARLQGFPDQFRCNQSDMQAYKQFGNSVTVPVIASLAKSISRYL